MNRFLDSRCRRESLPAENCPSLESLLTLLELVPALVWETDETSRITCLTGAAMGVVGVSLEACQGRPVWELFSAAGGPQSRKAHEAALLGQPGSFEAGVNGRELHANVKPLPGPDGKVAGVIGIAVDMTERLVLERALRLSEHGYRSISEEAPFAICRATLGGELLQVNRAMTEMLGYAAPSSPELLLRDLPLIFVPPGEFDLFRKSLLDRPAPGSRDCEWLRRDGSSIHVRVQGRVVRDPHGAISHLDIFAEDVTEKKRLESALRQAERMQAVGQLAGGIAHDFNNLLTVIGGHVEMILAGAPDAPLRTQLALVRQAAAKAASLTRQLLAYSRRQVLLSRDLNLNEVIEGLMPMLTRLIRENVEIVFRPGDSLRCVKADPNEMERVLVNLAVNAQDAMPEGGCLTIETANVTLTEALRQQPDEIEPGEYVQIVVRDNGSGMDSETQARAFEPFYTTKPPGEGTGLGLSVVYGVVRQSGGGIQLDSRPLAGTAIRIYLPAAAARLAEPAPAPPPAAAVLPRGAETVLVAEDDDAIRNLVAGTLEALGYRVLSAAHGISALQQAGAYGDEIHLLVTDVVMPGFGGRELAAALQQKAPALKVIFISGYAGTGSVDNGLARSSYRFLQKPFSMDSLASTVREILGQPSLANRAAAGVPR